MHSNQLSNHGLHRAINPHWMRVKEYGWLNESECYGVRLPLRSDLELTNLLPPANLQDQAGTLRKGPKEGAQIQDRRNLN